MKILNLYAGIGGNRKLWGDEHEVVAVENVPVLVPPEIEKTTEAPPLNTKLLILLKAP